jgi:hypothetical protein
VQNFDLKLEIFNLVSDDSSNKKGEISKYIQSYNFAEHFINSHIFLLG